MRNPAASAGRRYGLPVAPVLACFVVDKVAVDVALP